MNIEIIYRLVGCVIKDPENDQYYLIKSCEHHKNDESIWIELCEIGEDYEQYNEVHINSE